MSKAILHRREQSCAKLQKTKRIDRSSQEPIQIRLQKDAHRETDRSDKSALRE